LYRGGKRVTATVSGPYFESVEGFYAMMGHQAVIEMAACASLPMVEGRKDPTKTTTYGVGELIRHALDGGAKQIILGLGGSCTNDGGCGMASALGVRFFNRNGESFIPTGGTLKDIDRIDASGLDMRLTQLTVMCDIENTLYGKNGAAYVFAPQKGASKEQVKLLDDGLKHLSDMILAHLGRDISSLKGGGAAGGMGAGAAAFLNGTLTPGIDVILESADFASLLKDADLVITGEGSCDAQSLMGKALSGIARYTKTAGVPLIVVAGGVKGDIKAFYDAGVHAVVSCTRRPIAFKELAPLAEDFLRQSLTDALRLIRLGKTLK
jgi:glycerate kinase